MGLPKRRRVATVAWLVVAIAALAPAMRLGAAPLPPGAAAPDGFGPFSVGRTTFTETDPDRAGRQLTVDVWYPVDAADAAGVPPSRYDLLVTTLESEVALDEPPASGAGPFPLVVFSHGSGGIRFQSWFLTELLASHGFVVAAPDHAGNTAIDELLGTTTPFDVTARNRVLDVSTVIDAMLSRNADNADAFAGGIDPSEIAVAGHSFGGFTTIAVAAGWEDIAPDPRVDAIVPISPVSEVFSEAQLGGVAIPTLMLGGTADVTTPLDPQTSYAWSLISSPVAYRADVHDAGHSSFTNVCDLRDALLEAGLPPVLLDFLIEQAEQGCAPELIPIEEAHRLTRLYVVSFLRRHLGGDGAYQPFLTKGFASSNRLPVDFFRAS